ncbi:MAG: hypothetical protein LBK68_00065 [Candidatus Margulisbacteria bacterium]|jgi:hypothetical protein|nr:hypothetical protein [Candidatus Margulisiibacteriota bacterium]
MSEVDFSIAAVGGYLRYDVIKDDDFPKMTAEDAVSPGIVNRKDVEKFLSEDKTEEVGMLIQQLKSDNKFTEAEKVERILIDFRVARINETITKLQKVAEIQVSELRKRLQNSNKTQNLKNP